MSKRIFFLLVVICTFTYGEVLELFIGEQRTIPVPGALQIAIAGQGKVARGLLTADNSQMVVSGVSAGEVTLTVSFKDGRRDIWTIKVSGRETEALHLEASALISGFSSLTLRKSGTQIALSGNISTEDEDNRVRLITERYPEIINLTKDCRVDSLIQLDVEIVEVSASDGSDIGIDWISSTSTDASIKGGVSYGKLNTSGNEIVFGEKQIPENLIPGPAYALGPVARLSPVMAKIRLMIEKGNGSVLARPKIVCRSGDTARFLAGGQMPIAYATNEQAGVQWKSYGIKIKALPVLSGNDNRIRLSVDCEVSDLDWVNKVKDYPSLSEKSVSTHVNIKSDEMIALAGLISKKAVTSIRRLPVLGSIPFLGKLFSVESKEMRNLETVIMITPRIVRNGTQGISVPVIKSEK
ncbi:MAG: pilus assembly protein N-terminal domain-containing protein [Fibrobacteres bacterium]|nr:pilus assembly protein N-terminal domain-containing protein [Fibrobacterota bacterium]